MKKLNYRCILIIFMISLVLGCQKRSTKGTQNSNYLPNDFRQVVLKDYNAIPDSTRENELKMSFEEYYKFRQQRYLNKRRLLSSSTSLVSEANLCDNGTFESGNINVNDWIFIWGGGTYWNSNYTPDEGNNLVNTGSFEPTEDHSTEVHHQIVDIGSDPTFSALDMVWNVPDGNSHAIRLGNKGYGKGYESITKEITVSPSNWTLSFSYAMVVQNPGHGVGSDPSFLVNITDTNTEESHNYLVDLGDGNNYITSGHQSLQPPLPAGLRWKDWTCVTVDLSSLNGKEIKIEFENRDCTAGLHYGYTYLDNICLDCGLDGDEGGIEINTELSSDCTIPGQVCVDYTFPNGNNPSLDIILEIIQNGTVVATLNSPTLTTGNSYCFQLNESNASGVDFSLPGFDYKVTGLPKLGTFELTPKVLGNSLEGNVPGTNNDCMKYVTPICCPPMDTLLLGDLFNHVPLGTITSPFQLEFNQNAYFTAAFQAYLDYIYVTDPAIEKLVLHIRLIDAGTGDTPNDVFSPMVDDDPPTESWIWFVPGENGALFGNTNFFNATLNINHWYKIHTGIYTEPNNVFDNKRCQVVHRIFYRVDFIGGKMIGTFSDGERVLKQVDLENSNFLRRKG